MLMTKSRWHVLAGLSVCVTVPAAAQDSPTPKWAPGVDSIVRAEMARAQTPGAQVAVVQDGRIVYTKAYGVSDIESGRPVSEKTLFQVGSISKLTTAMLLAQLSAEGKVDLNAPISRYVPELAGKRVGAVTTHQLMTLSGGWIDLAEPNGNRDEGRLAEMARKQTDNILFTEPGSVYSYSNIGYGMVGYIAEAVVGRPFSILRDSVVLRGLGMPRATSRPWVAITYDFALGHSGPPGAAPTVVRPMPDNGVERPAGFLWSSAAELGRVAIALMNDGMVDGKQVFSAAAMRAMTVEYVLVPQSPPYRAGYWLNVGVVDGRRVWYGNGSVTGYVASMRMWPDQKLAVVVTSNRSPPQAAQPAAERVGALIGGFKIPVPVIYRPERDATPAERAQLVGRYGGGGTRRTNVEIAEVDGALELRLGPVRYPVRVTNTGDHIVLERAGAENLVYVIIRDAAGNVAYLHLNGRAFARQP
jgi:CubicO group peptidase (beta-lactamase class C family)